MKRIGMLTSGGDCQALNATIKNANQIWPGQVLVLPAA